MHIETPTTTVHKSDKTVFEFLSDLKNFENLMPDSIDKFQVLDEDTFLFSLKGMPEIVLKRKEQNPYNKIILSAAGGKLSFTLTAEIAPKSENESEVTLHFDGEFNAMMAMMIKTPITNFMRTLSGNLGKM